MIENQRQLDNTRQKLERLERLYEQEQQRAASRSRDLTLRSLKQTINEFKEEIALFQAHERTAL